MRIEILRQNYDIDIKLVHFPLHLDTPPEGREMAGFYAERGLDPRQALLELEEMHALASQMLVRELLRGDPREALREARQLLERHRTHVGS